MAEKEPEFVVTDRRKFRMEGDEVKENPEHEAPPAETKPEAPDSVAAAAPAAVEQTKPGPVSASDLAREEASTSAPQSAPSAQPDQPAPEMPPAPTAEESAAGARAYQQTTERLDDIVRANNLGGEREPPVNFERLVQSFSTTALLQLGVLGVPGQQARMDLMGARNSIDLLAVLAEKTKGNLSADEQKLLDTVLYELRVAFLETMQALSEQAQRQQQAGKAPAGSPPGVTPFPAGGKPRR